MGEWMMILQEELGEFAEACQKGKVQSKETDASDRKHELVQVVAVALTMLEQVIEEEKKAVNKKKLNSLYGKYATSFIDENVTKYAVSSLYPKIGICETCRNGVHLLELHCQVCGTKNV
jgi:NTP pyrophosphatase (non-canonical NTP hydrolase)